MADPYLEQMIKGLTAENGKSKNSQQLPVKDRFEIAIDHHIDEMLNSSSFENTAEQDNLLSPQSRRKKMEVELKESLNEISEFNKQVEVAVKLLFTEGGRYLNALNYSIMVEELSRASEILKHLDLTAFYSDSLGRVLALSEETIDSIFKVAIIKFEEEEYPSSLALFIFLTVLQSNNFDFWYRSGIVAQKCGNFALAIQAYENAAALNPALVEAHLFAAECHCELNQWKEAESEYAQAKQANDTYSPEDKKIELFEYVKGMVQK